MNLTTKMKIGYIKRFKNENGVEKFEFIESPIKRVNIGKKGTTFKADRFCTLDAEEVESNTDLVKQGMKNGYIIVSEPFITDDEISEHYKKTVEYWNEHGVTSLF